MVSHTGSRGDNEGSCTILCATVHAPTRDSYEKFLVRGGMRRNSQECTQVSWPARTDDHLCRCKSDAWHGVRKVSECHPPLIQPDSCQFLHQETRNRQDCHLWVRVRRRTNRNGANHGPPDLTSIPRGTFGRLISSAITSRLLTAA